VRPWGSDFTRPFDARRLSASKAADLALAHVWGVPLSATRKNKTGDDHPVHDHRTV